MVARGACCLIAPLLAFAASAQQPAAESLAYEIVLNAKAVRTVTAAPTLDAELVALRELVAQGDAAVPALRKLAREATPAGRVLALCALEVRGDPECAALRAKLMAAKQSVLVAYSSKLAWSDLPLSEVIASTRPDAVRKSRGSPPERWGFTTGTPDVLGGGLPWGTVLQPPPSDPSLLADLPIATWIERLGTPNSLIRRETEAVLVSLGAASVAPLASALSEPTQARWAAGALGRLGFLALPALPALRKGLSATQPMTRLACAATLRGLGPYASRAAAELARRAADPDELQLIRLTCASACPELDGTLRVDLATTALKHPDPFVADLHEALAPSENVTPGGEHLLRLMAEAGLDLDEESWQAFLEASPPPFVALAAAACSRSATVREVARGVLVSEPEGAARALRPLLADTDPLRRGQAAVALLSVPQVRAEASGVLAGCLSHVAIAPALLPGLFDLVELPPAVVEALIALACQAASGAELAAQIYLALPAERRAASEAGLLERVRGKDPGRRAALLALRTKVWRVVGEATAVLVELLADEDPTKQRGAAALLIEGGATGDTLAAAWHTIEEALQERDPRAQDTLLRWARASDLASPAAELETSWLSGSEPHLLAYAAGGWVDDQPDLETQEAARSALLRVVIQPASLPAHIAARRAFAVDAELVSTVLEGQFGEELGAIMYRGLVAALLGDPDGLWAARVFADLQRDLDLTDPGLGAQWGEVFAKALPRSTPPVRWQLVRALQRLGSAATRAAPALRKTRSTTTDPELQLAIEEALRAVLGA